MQFKTNWSPNDEFTITEYNRIKQNILDVKMEANSCYNMMSLQAMETAVILPFPSLINNVENNLTSIINDTHCSIATAGRLIDEEIGGKAWGYKDLNRIELNLLLIHNQILSKQNGLKLNFELGGEQFG